MFHILFMRHIQRLLLLGFPFLWLKKKTFLDYGRCKAAKILEYQPSWLAKATLILIC